MKLHLLDRSSFEDTSFTVKRNVYPNFLKIWHYHPEIELVVILKSKGTRFIGDNVEKFDEGEVVLIGKNLPHMWLNDEAYFKDDSVLKAEAIAVHFKEDFLGTHFLKLQEMKPISELLVRAEQGIKFKKIKKILISQINELTQLNGFEKTIQLLTILNALASNKEYKLLSTKGFLNSFQITHNKRLDAIYEYIFKNFRKTISLAEIAAVATMNPSAFSRFFKKIHRKTFTAYVNEIRIGYACKLLQEQKYSITTVCFESGFANVSNFNRQFKKITKQSPTEYIHKLPK
ncbi:MAG: AraC family transcriptional regulator [Flavobacteriaceae bacterium]|nr:AraC family transcriptional regulator [Flavobacteriaceae bacterium]